MKSKLTPQQVKELAEKKLKEKYEAGLKKVQEKFDASTREEPPERTDFDKMLGGIMNVPKPKEQNGN